MIKARAAVAAAVVLFALVFPQATSEARPVPVATVTLQFQHFGGGCSTAIVTLSWDRWRTDTTILKVRNSTNSADFATSVAAVVPRPSRSGYADFYVGPPSGSSSWAEVGAVRGFGAAQNSRSGSSINDLTDPATCVPPA